ncbi:hypothetical protein D3C87_2049410 [compost metagenome]
MVSAYANEKQVVLVVINYGNEERVLKPEVSGIKVKGADVYLTTGEKGVDMKRSKVGSLEGGVTIPTKSIKTIVIQN